TATGVTVGGTACTSFTKKSPTSVSCVTPAKSAGAYDVIVTNSTGPSTALSGAFTYFASASVTAISPTSSGTGGGSGVTITGTGFRAGATVTIGTFSCGSVVLNSSTSISCVTSAGTAGAYRVSVTNTNMDPVSSADNLFTYEGSPSIIGLSP